MPDLHWTHGSLEDVPESGAERFFDDLRLMRVGRTVWAWFEDFMPVSFPFGELGELFDESSTATGGTRRLIAAAPVAYLLVGEGTLHLEDVTTGTYRQTWIDFSTGSVADPVEVVLDGGDETFIAPVQGTVGLALQRIGL